MTRLHPSALLLALTGIALAACGGGDDGPGVADAGAPAAAPPAGETAPAAGAPTADEPAIHADRYAGLYGVEGELRGRFFVTEADEPNRITIGAVWGDVAPWVFRPESATRFVQAFVPDHSPEAIVVTFELDAGGNARALTFETVFDEYARRPRLGDVPDDWR